MYTRAMLTLINVMFFAQNVLAAKDDDDTSSEGSTLVEWLIGAVFIVGCLAIAFKGSKRAALD